MEECEQPNTRQFLSAHRRQLQLNISYGDMPCIQHGRLFVHLSLVFITHFICEFLSLSFFLSHSLSLTDMKFDHTSTWHLLLAFLFPFAHGIYLKTFSGSFELLSSLPFFCHLILTLTSVLTQSHNLNQRHIFHNYMPR